MKLAAAIFLMSFLSMMIGAQEPEVVPIIEMQSGGLLGGVANGRWFDAKTTRARLGGAEKSYSLFGTGGKTGAVTASIDEADERCTDYYYAKSAGENRRGTALGPGLSWNPVPRAPRAIEPRDKTYLKVVGDILRAKGLPRATPIIEQAVKIDLDGDGSDEVLLTASSYGGTVRPGAKAGDYSFVVLRKIVKGRVKNIMIAEEYVKKTVNFGAVSRFELSAVADLNGDGKMEIVLYGEYYEGSGAGVYEIKDSQAVEIPELETGCGA